MIGTNANLFNYNLCIGSICDWVAFGRFTGMGGFPGKYVNSVCTNFARKLDGRLVSAARHHKRERKGKKRIA